MKKVILLSSLLIGGAAFAQTSPINFEPDGNGADFSWATFEAPEGFDNPTFTVEANPVTDGINSSATAARIDIAYPTDDFWGKAGCETDNPGMDMGIFTFDESNSTVKVMIFQEGFAAPVALKFANTTFGAELETVVNNEIADEWVEIEFDMSSLINSGVAPFSQFIFFPSYAPRETGHVVWFDNVTFEEGDPPAGDPMVSAPDPTIDESEVISVYSEYYQTNTVDNFNFNDFQGGGLITEVDIESDGNLAGKIEGLTFYGAAWDAEDVSDFLYVHLDYWSTSSGSFNFYLIDQTAGIPGGAIEEPRYSFGVGGDQEVVQGEWVSVFIPLQHFLDYDAGTFDFDLNDIGQYKFDGNGTLWFDNIYFTSNPLSVDNVVSESLSAFPNPSVDSWTVSSDLSSINEVRVYNALGQVVLSISPNASMTQIDASGLDKGFYIAEIRTDRGTGIIKLIKE
ncbi:MAG TPA: T9SS type A sorting domain-containing protein [Cryomorphaceae bacterium]|nr:T9SS type A sorting domain-containing protein [Cryomorphaceae bacterium]